MNNFQQEPAACRLRTILKSQNDGNVFAQIKSFLVVLVAKATKQTSTVTAQAAKIIKTL